jgi:multidrug efflux system outer membrane protein
MSRLAALLSKIDQIRGAVRITSPFGKGGLRGISFGRLRGRSFVKISPNPSLRLDSGHAFPTRGIGNGAVLLSVLGISGCMIGADYRRPDVTVPPGWRMINGDPTAVINEQWWSQFNDSHLDRLIEIALAENLDVASAVARVEEARALVDVSRAALFPQVGASADAGRSRSSIGTTPLPGVSLTNNFYSAVVDASFELDLWGRLRRATEAARAVLLSTEYAAQVVRLALVSQVAQSYFDLRNLDLQLDIARGTLASREEALRLVTKRFEGGVVSELDLRQAESEAAVAAAAVPNLEQQIVQRENELSILLGRNPEDITRGRGIFESAIPEVPVGLPSTLLVRRPDILAAEESLVAANARVGAARAAYFPRLSLTGLLGVESTDLSDWLNGGSRVWQIAGGLTAPIFTAGRLGAEVETATAQQQQALYDYLRTIQTGLREVEDSLIATRKIREQQAAQDRQVQALQRTLRLATLRYENGYSSFLEVLDAQRSLFSAELQQVQLQRARLGAIVNLYKALGGGWVP